MLNSSPATDTEKCVMEQNASAQEIFSWTLEFSRTLDPVMKSRGDGEGVDSRLLFWFVLAGISVLSVRCWDAA